MSEEISFETAQEKAAPVNQSPVKYFISGGFGGICTVLVGHPFDTIKVRLQTTQLTGTHYDGMIDCAKKTIQKEGVRGLYKGMSAPIAGKICFKSLYNFFYTLKSKNLIPLKLV